MGQHKLVIGIIGAVFMAGSAAAAVVSVDDAVSHALDQYENKRTEAVSQLQMASLSPAAPVKAQYVKAVEKAVGVSGGLLVEKADSFSLGYEQYAYTYKESFNGDHIMDYKGAYQGINGSWTHRLTDHEGIPEMPDVFRLETRLAWAQLDYNGGIQDQSGNHLADVTLSKVPDMTVEARGIMGKEMFVKNIMFMPYTGVGYRFLRNDTSKKSGSYVLGGTTYIVSGYRRISQYYYLPLGLEVRKAFLQSWTLGGNLEYDYLLKGAQASYTPHSANASVSNSQRHGQGYRASVKLEKDFTHVGISVEPFVRYWQLQKSDFACSDYVTGGCFGMIEPANVTQEVGVKMGVIF
ncbi:MAG: hypothetical protein HQL19_02610 [Candidatus Omnitrophica bacterium]|nr:hypothetical protein [Candidatus Omnitrophota bacterium]